MHKTAHPLYKWQFCNISDFSFVILGEAYRMHSSRLAFPFPPTTVPSALIRLPRATHWFLHLVRVMVVPRCQQWSKGLTTPQATPGSAQPDPFGTTRDASDPGGDQEHNCEHCDTGHFSDVWEAHWPPQQVPPRFKQLLACIYIVSNITLLAQSFSLLVGRCFSYPCP